MSGYIKRAESALKVAPRDYHFKRAGVLKVRNMYRTTQPLEANTNNHTEVRGVHSPGKCL